MQLYGLTAVGTVRGTPKPAELPMFDELIMVDLDDVSTLRNIQGDFEAVIHVASASYGAPADLMRITGIATDSLARAAVSLGVKRFVHVSAMSVYGKPDVAVVSSKTPVRHSIPYGAAKWAAECYLHNLQDQIPSISIRSPAIVGSFPSTHTHFLARVLRTMLTGTEVVRLSNPEFLFNNVVHEETLAKFLVHLATTTHVGFVAVPVGSSEPLLLSEVVEMIVKATRFKGHIEWVESPSRPFSISLDDARLLGFEPLTTYETIQMWLDSL